MAEPGCEPRILELTDGTKVHVRPIVPEDEPLLIEAVAAMSERTVYFRFFSPLKRLPDALAHRLAVVDYNDRFALVATTHKSSERIVGVAPYDRVAGTDVAETAVAVVGEFQRRGLGGALLAILAQADAQVLAFIGGAVLLAVTPGPDMAVVTKNALAHGRRGVLLTTTGIALALAIWVSATAVGLSALLRASGELLFVLKLVGAAYLAYLGVRTLLESRRRPADLPADAPPSAPAPAIFRQGFLSAVSNPKLGG